MTVYVLTIIHNLDYCEVAGVFGSRVEAEEACARLVGWFGMDVHEVSLNSPVKHPLHEGPLTPRGGMVRRWDEP